MHGIPQNLCHHHDILFLPWHRAYLYTLELSFRDLFPAFTLAYWDWTSPPAQAQGLPAAYTAATDAAGQPNPLLAAPANIPQAQITQLQNDPQAAHSFDFSVSPPLTVRDPDQPSDLPTVDAARDHRDIEHVRRFQPPARGRARQCAWMGRRNDVADPDGGV
jgi:hypothetical protein